MLNLQRSHQLNSTSSSLLKGAMDSEGAYSNSGDVNQVLALPLLYLLLSPEKSLKSNLQISTKYLPNVSRALCHRTGDWDIKQESECRTAFYYL